MRKMMMPLAGAAVLALAFSLAFAGDAKKSSGGVKPGDEAPAFSLQDQNGKTVNLSDYNGKIVVLEWFNNGCPYVVRHYKAKTMNDLAGKWKDKDVVWLAVNSTAGKTAADDKAIAGEWSINHPNLSDTDGTVGKAYGAKSTPHMFIIDKTGKIAYKGAIDNDPENEKGDKKVNYVDKALTELTSGTSVSEPQTQSYGCGIKYAK
jgi:peroxiredoxin